MRTTTVLPDLLYCEVKATAARQGMRLKSSISEALQDKWAGVPISAKRLGMKCAGSAALDLEIVAVLKRIGDIVEETFGQIDVERWNSPAITSSAKPSPTIGTTAAPAIAPSPANDN